MKMTREAVREDTHGTSHRRWWSRPRLQIYGVNAPVYDPRMCTQCKMTVHAAGCPVLFQERRVMRLKEEQAQRDQVWSGGGGD